MKEEGLHAAIANISKQTEEVINDGHEAMKAIILISLEMDRQLGTRTFNPLPGFSDIFDHQQKQSSEPLLDKCRLISGSSDIRK